MKFVVVVACCLGLACSADRKPGACAADDLACASGAGGSATGGAGGAGGLASGGAGGALGSGSGGTGQLDAGIPDGGLRVRVQGEDGMTLEVITLQCAGDCVELEAIARGGHPPYTFEWDDGSSGAKRRVCLDAAQSIGVSVTDTGVTSDEFIEYAAQTVRAQLTASVLDCTQGRDAGKPGQPCDERVEGDAGTSFDPIVKWSWSGGGTLVTPLVANLTDDNDDGDIDARDTPDVVVIDNLMGAGNGALVVLDGRTGTEHFRVEHTDNDSTPALGDLDGDGTIEILATFDDFSLRALRHDGTPLWTTVPGTLPSRYAVTLAIADLDHDGTPEILAGEQVYDAQGELLWAVSPDDASQFNSPIAADLDDDGYLEVVWGAIAHRHDGAQYYRNAELFTALPDSGDYVLMGQYAAIADLDLDGVPEVVVITPTTLFVLDHQGKTRDAVERRAHAYPFPPAIADLNGDGAPEIMVSDGMAFTAYTEDTGVLWEMPVVDMSGIAAGTAFDFLGDGTAEAMYGDETVSWGFDGRDGHVIFMQPRSSGTLIEYPSVADVDNDGSADILIVSNNNLGPVNEYGVRMISDRDGRWVPARRILNQEAYHVTNVNDDGTIPQYEIPSWKLNNSFRAQAQINVNGTVCLPER